MTKKNLTIAYFGSSEASAVFLEKMLTASRKLHIHIPLVFTYPDKPAGRGMHIKKSPTKLIAEKYQVLPVHESPRQSVQSVIELLQEHAVELCVVYAYGEIIPQTVIQIPRYGFINVHPSLLPKYRGPSPVVFPLALGEGTTGCTLIQMNAKMDEGDILTQSSRHISIDDTSLSLLAKLSDDGLALLKNVLSDPSIVHRTPQKHALSTYTLRLTREDGYIDITDLQHLLNQQPIPLDSQLLFKKYFDHNLSLMKPELIQPSQLYSLWQAVTPWPGLWTQIRLQAGMKRLKLIRCTQNENVVQVQKVQLEGKNIVDIDVFESAYGKLESLIY